MAIKLINICKSYGSNRVLNNVNLEIKNGSLLCIMGLSGGGKTTLLNIMMGLVKADSGKIEGLKPLSKSAVFQEDRLCESLSAASNIRIVCKKPITNEAINNALCAVGLSESYAAKPVKSMSGGQRRRIAILRALMAEYDILFMDEPFKGLDAETKNLVMDYTKKCICGKTVILVTHDKDEYLEMGGQMLILKGDMPPLI